MSRLIDADKVFEVLYSHRRTIMNRRGETVGIIKNVDIDEIAREIDELPTVDAVEVVRCKDCRDYGEVYCPMESPTEPDDFCSRGERR